MNEIDAIKVSLDMYHNGYDQGIQDLGTHILTRLPEVTADVESVGNLIREIAEELKNED